MSKTNTPADDRIALLEEEIRILKEEVRREKQAAPASGVDEIASVLRSLIEPTAERMAQVDPAEATARFNAKKQELCNRADELQRASYRDLFHGETGFTLHILEPHKPGRGEIGQDPKMRPYPGMGLVVFASSATAAEVKYRNFYGIREVFDARVLVCHEIQPAERAERIRQALLTAVEEEPTKAKGIMEQLASRAAIDRLPKLSATVADELDALLT